MEILQLLSLKYVHIDLSGRSFLVSVGQGPFLSSGPSGPTDKNVKMRQVKTCYFLPTLLNHTLQQAYLCVCRQNHGLPFQSIKKDNK